jgi:outer membrane PBP1 activator LpoA protein
LFAFGFDAGQLALALRDPRWQWPLAGVTGRLTPDADRRLRRDLDWAQIHNGKPQALSPTAVR